MYRYGIIALLVLMTSAAQAARYTEGSGDQKIYDIIQRSTRDIATLMENVRTITHRQEVEMENLKTLIQRQNTETENVKALLGEQNRVIGEMNERMNEQGSVLRNTTTLLRQGSKHVENLLDEKEDLMRQIAELSKNAGLFRLIASTSNYRTLN